MHISGSFEPAALSERLDIGLQINEIHYFCTKEVVLLTSLKERKAAIFGLLQKFILLRADNICVFLVLLRIKTSAL